MVVALGLVRVWSFFWGFVCGVPSRRGCSAGGVDAAVGMCPGLIADGLEVRGGRGYGTS